MKDDISASILSGMNRAGIGYAITDRQGRITDTNEAYRSITGLAADEDRPWFERDVAPDKLKKERIEGWAAFLNKPDVPWKGIVRWYRSDEDIRFFEGTACTLEDDAVLLVTVDRTDLINSNQSLAEQGKRYRRGIEDFPICIALYDRNGDLMYVNKYLPQRLGFDGDDSERVDSMRKAFASHLKPLGDNLIERMMRGDDLRDGELAHLDQGPLSGTHWLVVGNHIESGTGRLVNYVTAALDRTDSIRLQDAQRDFANAVHEQQKIAVLNDFAGTLAHELSNILHPVGAYAKMLSANPDHPSREDYAAKINTGAMAAGRLLRRTLSMSRRDQGRLERVDISGTLSETIASASELAPKGLSYTLDIPSAPVIAVTVLGELRQVMLNLLNNAAEAMHYQGAVRVSVTEGAVPEGRLDVRPSGAPPFVCISVRDDGLGMDAATLARVFEPFFTTKPAGRGTGLGLAVVQGLVTGWGGMVSAESEECVGTTFRVWLSQADMKD